MVGRSDAKPGNKQGPRKRLSPSVAVGQLSGGQLLKGRKAILKEGVTSEFRRKRYGNGNACEKDVLSEK